MVPPGATVAPARRCAGTARFPPASVRAATRMEVVTPSHLGASRSPTRPLGRHRRRDAGARRSRDYGSLGAAITRGTRSAGPSRYEARKAHGTRCEPRRRQPLRRNDTTTITSATLSQAARSSRRRGRQSRMWSASPKRPHARGARPGRGPHTHVTLDEMVAKSRTVVERVRPIVDRAVGKLRARFARSSSNSSPGVPSCPS